jgi:hypothetical protein
MQQKIINASLPNSCSFILQQESRRSLFFKTIAVTTISFFSLVIPLMTAFAALVKNTHGFIGRSNLHLQKICLLVIAVGTCCHGSIDMFPGRGTAQYIIDLFAFRRCLNAAWARNWTRIRTRAANKHGTR